MNDERNDEGWPSEAGATENLARERQAPVELENRVVAALAERGLIRRPRRRAVTWRSFLAAAASLVLVAGGYWLGAAKSGPAGSGAPPTTSDAYALLLYETADFDVARGDELLKRYNEYSRWVGDARQRGQFVTGEDLETTKGWTLRPGVSEVEAAVGAKAPDAAVLSGVFLVTGEEEGVLALAEKLPHLLHGGQVVVQRVVPTDSPPSG